MDTMPPNPAFPLPAEPPVDPNNHVPEGQAPESTTIFQEPPVDPNGHVPEGQAPESTAIFQQTLIEFREDLAPSQVDEFSRTTLVHVQRKVIEIQSRQEANKEMMNLTRLQLFLEQFSNFDSLCKEAKVWGDHATALSNWIWGPSLYILKTASEHSKTLESILDGYCKLGNQVPATSRYRDLVLSNPKVAKTLAYMYLDLLTFHKRMVKLLRCKGWRKTFESSWKDYDGEFKILLANFKTHSELLSILLNTWEQRSADEQMGRSQDDHANIQNITHRLNDLVVRVQDVSQDSGQHASQTRAILTRSEGVWKDIRQQVNDHTIQAADSQQVLKLLVSMFERLRDSMTWQFNKLEENRKAEMKRHVLSLMSNPGMSQVDHHEAIRHTRTPETGNWLLEDSVVGSWLHESPPSTCIVWLRGRMGAGKTVLTSLIIEECRAKPDFHTSYFYCRGDDEQQNTSPAVLMGILSQMAQKNDDLIAYCNDKSNEGPLGQINVVKHLLEVFCESDTNRFVVIDGLDECEKSERKIIVDFWRTMVDKIDYQKRGKLRVFLVSQDKPDIEASLKSQETGIVYVHPAYTDKDIDTYVRQKSPLIQERFQLGPDKNRFLENLICKRAEGMFLYAYLTIENLLQQPNIGFYEAELEQNLPQGLSDAYNKTIERLKRTHHANSWIVSRKILTWLAGSMRPLKETELAAALAIELDYRGVSFNYHARRLVEDIRVMCGSLVRVVKCAEETRIEFTHSSTRSFLREHMEHEGLGEKSIEFDLATKCLWYLTLPCFKPGLSSDELRNYARNGYYALQDYASAELRRHIQQLILHTAPMFGLYSPKAAENTSKLVTALRRFLSFYRDVKPLSEDALSSESSLPSVGASPVAISETPSFAWESSAESYSQDSLFVTPVPTARSSLSPFPSSASSTAPQDPNGDPVAFCEPFRAFPELYPLLAQLWAHLYGHKCQVDPEERERVSIRQLRTAVQASRAAVQGLGAVEGAPADRQAAHALYGDRLYKCERVPCDFFFEGFTTAGELKEHAQRHAKPYRCKVPDCSLARFGFSNKKDREKHVRNYHSETADGPLLGGGSGNGEGPSAGGGGGPADDDDDADEGDDDQGARRTTQHICAACGKRFTRKANLDSHMDTHNGVRRHSCEACGKAFTRRSDLHRHEKIHRKRTRGR